MSEPLRFIDGLPSLATRQRRLPCGLEVVVHADHAIPQVAVSVWYRVGSSDDQNTVVLSGLNPGDLVITGQTVAAPQSGGASLFGPRGGPGGGGGGPQQKPGGGGGGGGAPAGKPGGG